MSEVQTVSVAVASASVTLAAIYYVWQIRHQMKMRQTDLVMKLYLQFNSLEFQKIWNEVLDREAKGYNDYKKKYGPVEVSAVGLFFEGIGILLRRKLIDIELVDDMFTMPIKDTWQKIKDDVERLEIDQPYSNGLNTYSMKWKRENRSFMAKRLGVCSNCLSASNALSEFLV